MDHNGQVERAPPPPHRVLARAAVLAAVAWRGRIEAEPVGDAETLRRNVLAWLRDLGADAELDANERTLLATSVGKLDERRMLDASWRAEGLAVLAWALRSTELPPHDCTCAPTHVSDAVGFLQPRPDGLPMLRAFAEIERWRETYLALHWRLRHFSLTRTRLDYRALLESIQGDIEPSGIPIWKGDLRVAGTRIDLAPEEAWRWSLSIVQERHHAFNWLCGDADTYSEVRTDT